MHFPKLSLQSRRLCRLRGCELGFVIVGNRLPAEEAPEPVVERHLALLVLRELLPELLDLFDLHLSRLEFIFHHQQIVLFAPAHPREEAGPP